MPRLRWKSPQRAATTTGPEAEAVESLDPRWAGHREGKSFGFITDFVTNEGH